MRWPETLYVAGEVALLKPLPLPDYHAPGAFTYATHQALTSDIRICFCLLVLGFSRHGRIGRDAKW